MIGFPVACCDVCGRLVRIPFPDSDPPGASWTYGTVTGECGLLYAKETLTGYDTTRCTGVLTTLDGLVWIGYTPPRS